jgi:hypothetical protein
MHGAAIAPAHYKSDRDLWVLQNVKKLSGGNDRKD